MVHGLRRGDRRARVCGCVTHMKTDDGSGADVRSQPPRDGKFMRSATAEKWGAGGGYITYKSHASSVRRNRFECRSTPSVTPRPRALYGSYVTRQLSYVGYTGDRARTAPSPPATATFVIGIVRAIGFGSEIGISARVRARAAVVVQFFDVRKLYNSFRGSRCRGRGMRCRMFDAATIGPFS